MKIKLLFAVFVTLINRTLFGHGNEKEAILRKHKTFARDVPINDSNIAIGAVLNWDRTNLV